MELEEIDAHSKISLNHLMSTFMDFKEEEIMLKFLGTLIGSMIE